MNESNVGGNMPQEIIPSLKDYNVIIRFLDKGCVIEIGCKSIAFENSIAAMEELKQYVINHKDTYLKWQETLKKK